MKLYVARAETEYEGFHIIRVYTTSDRAKDSIEADKSVTTYVDAYSIEEIELDRDYLGSDHLDRYYYDVRVK